MFLCLFVNLFTRGDCKNERLSRNLSTSLQYRNNLNLFFTFKNLDRSIKEVMVVKIVWIQSWVTVSISLCVLLVLILFIIICLCWDGRDSKSQHELYTMEANRQNRTHETINSQESSSAGFFRRISSTNLLKTKLKMPGSNTILANFEKDQHLLPNEKELLDSLDVDKQFDKSVLKIDICDKHLLQQDQDDNKSCDSSDSRRTFYSIYPYSRANSVAETMRSALSCPDVNDY